MHLSPTSKLGYLFFILLQSLIVYTLIFSWKQFQTFSIELGIRPRSVSDGALSIGRGVWGTLVLLSVLSS